MVLIDLKYANIVLKPECQYRTYIHKIPTLYLSICKGTWSLKHFVDINILKLRQMVIPRHSLPIDSFRRRCSCYFLRIRGPESVYPKSVYLKRIRNENGKRKKKKRDKNTWRKPSMILSTSIVQVLFSYINMIYLSLGQRISRIYSIKINSRIW